MVLVSRPGLDLEAIPEALVVDRKLVCGLGSQSSIIIASEHKVYHWSAEGRLLRTLDPGGVPVLCHFLGGQYLVTLAGTPGQTLVFGADGEPIAWQPSSGLAVIHDLFRVGSQVFVGQRDPGYLAEHPYPFLANSINLVLGQEGIHCLPGEFSLFKANERIRGLFFQYPQVWLVAPQGAATHSGPQYLAVDALENRVYSYTSEAILAGKTTGQQLPEQIPYISLNLPKYQEPPRDLFNPGLVLIQESNREDYLAQKQAWEMGLGLIRLFDRYEDGYLLVYEIPDYDDSDTCVGYHLGVAKMSSEFQVRSFQEIEGEPLGLQTVDSGQVLTILSSGPNKNKPNNRLHLTRLKL